MPIGWFQMRRRQIFYERECAIRQQEAAKESDDMGIKVVNANIISNSAQEALKEKANMFLPHESAIVKPNGTPYRKKGSKPGAGAPNHTASKNKY